MSIKILRLIGTLEGISFLLLLLFAMPMKYFYDQPFWVKYIGMGHGVLFLLFILALFIVCQLKKMVCDCICIRSFSCNFAVWSFCF